MKYWILFFIVSCAFTKSYSQVDTTYVQKFNKKYAVEVFTSYRMLSVEYDKLYGKTTSFEPNSSGGIGVGFSWKNSGMSYVFQIPVDGTSGKGKTTSRDFQYHHFADSYIVDLYYQKYKGFTSGVDNKFENGDYYQDMQVNLYGGMIQFVHNYKQYSIAAAHQQNRKQLKSAGSLLYGFNFFYAKMLNMPEFSDATAKYNRKTYNFGPNVGYGYNWIFYQDFFVAGSFSIGVNGVVAEDLKDRNTKFEVAPQLGARVSLGYVTDDWVISISTLLNGMYDRFTSDFNSKLVSTSMSLSVSKRFDMKRDLGIFKKDYIDYFRKSDSNTKEIELIE